MQLSKFSLPALTSEQWYPSLTVNAQGVLLNWLLPNPTSSKQPPFSFQQTKSGVGSLLLSFGLRCSQKRQYGAHTTPGSKSPLLYATWDWSRKGLAFARFPDQNFLAREGDESAGTQLSSWSILSFHRALPKLCMIQPSRTAHISDQIVHKVPATAWKVTPAIKCW